MTIQNHFLDWGYFQKKFQLRSNDKPLTFTCIYINRSGKRFIFSTIAKFETSCNPQIICSIRAIFKSNCIISECDCTFTLEKLRSASRHTIKLFTSKKTMKYSKFQNYMHIETYYSDRVTYCRRTFNTDLWI